MIKIMSSFDLKEHCDFAKIGIEKNVVISILSNQQDFVADVQRKKHKKKRRKIFSYFFKAHTGSLLLILGAYTTIIFIACTILVLSVFRLENLTDHNTIQVNSKSTAPHEKLNKSSPEYSDIKLSNKLFRQFIWPYKDSSKLFNCSVLNQVTEFKYLTSGWTKSVFSFNHNGQSFALKTVNLKGNDLKSCMQSNLLKTCYEKASSKMYKEYILSRELSHTNIIKVFGWCVSNDSLLENVAIVTELCSPIDTVSLLQMPFKERLHIIFNIIQLVRYLSASSLGSVAINDFRRQQFVLCGKTPKLTDLDDLSVEEPRCNENSQCSLGNLYKYLKLPVNLTGNDDLRCINYLCKGYNEKQNIINVYKHFIHLFLTIGTPAALKNDVESFLRLFLSQWNSKAVFKEIEYIYTKLNTSYMNEQL